MNSKLRTTILALGAAALLVPTGATAKSEKAAGKGPQAKSEHASEGKAKGHAKAKNAVVKGTVVSVEGTTVTVTVEKANRWGRRLKGTDAAFTVDAVKKLGVRDTNGDGTADAADIVAGDKVHVQARITRDAEAPFAARKLKVKYPEAEGEGEGETEEAPAP